MRFLSLLVSALALLTAARHPVQAPPADGSPCGTMANTQGRLDRFTKYFVEDEYALMRDPNVQQQPPTVARTVVADTTVCRAVLDAALLKMRTEAPGWPEEEETRGFDHAVFQYGPYYGILLQLNPDPSTGMRYHWTPLLVFRGSDMLYLQTWLV